MSRNSKNTLIKGIKPKFYISGYSITEDKANEEPGELKIILTVASRKSRPKIYSDFLNEFEQFLNNYNPNYMATEKD